MSTPRTARPTRPTRRRHPAGAAIAVLAVVGTAACGGGGADAGNADAGKADVPATVTVATFAFEPDPLVVPAGTTITFVNEDAIDHTVTAGTRDAPTPEVFDGQLPEQGATFELTLAEPGTYDYFCEVHPGPGMTATVTVE